MPNDTATSSYIYIETSVARINVEFALGKERFYMGTA